MNRIIWGFNIYLLPIFGIWGSIIVGAITYGKQINLKITKANIIIILILVLSMPFKQNIPDIRMLMFLGVLLLPYIFFIPYLTGLRKIWNKWKLFLYFYSWSSIILLCMILAWDVFQILENPKMIIENQTTYYGFIYEEAILYSNSSISDIMSLFGENKTISGLDFFAKWLISSYIGLIFAHLFWIILRMMLVEKKTINLIIEDFWSSDTDQIKELKGIGLIILLMLINHVFHFINDYTLTSLMFFVNIALYNKLIKKSPGESPSLWI